VDRSCHPAHADCKGPAEISEPALVHAISFSFTGLAGYDMR
jgi:hypothetical protein